MELRGSMSHSQGLSNNPYPEPNYSNFLKIHSHIVFSLPTSLFPVGVPVMILKGLLSSSILLT